MLSWTYSLKFWSVKYHFCLTVDWCLQRVVRNDRTRAISDLKYSPNGRFGITRRFLFQTLNLLFGRFRIEDVCMYRRNVSFIFLGCEIHNALESPYLVYILARPLWWYRSGNFYGHRYLDSLHGFFRNIFGSIKVLKNLHSHTPKCIDPSNVLYFGIHKSFTKSKEFLLSFLKLPHLFESIARVSLSCYCDYSHSSFSDFWH